MPRNLPPLAQIRSLVAVAAHGRVNRAAAALNLTESAVSHHLRKLEDALDVSLVDRSRSRVALTSAGERFHTRAQQALALLDEAVDEVGVDTRGRVLLTLPRPVATHWLVPNFPSLYQENGDLEIQILPTARTCDLAREQIDLGIRLGRGEWEGLEAYPLMQQYICPVATPPLASKWREQGWDAMAQRGRLIGNETHPEEWTQWCSATGHDMPAESRFSGLELFDFVFQAGLAGSGLIMGRSPMVNDAVAKGDLIAPFPEWVKTEFSYYLVWPMRRPPKRNVRRVFNWLVACAEEGAVAPPVLRSG